jgi:hypothetical protein
MFGRFLLRPLPGGRQISSFLHCLQGALGHGLADFPPFPFSVFFAQMRRALFAHVAIHLVVIRPRACFDELGRRIVARFVAPKFREEFREPTPHQA